MNPLVPVSASEARTLGWGSGVSGRGKGGLNLSDNRSHFEVSLRIWHPLVDPAEISRELGWTPKVSRMVGEPRSTLKGAPLPGTNKESFWFVVLPPIPGGSISSVIREANQRLISRRAYLHSLVSTGGVLEYFVGWFIDANEGEIIDWQVLAECGDLKIRFHFDVYPPDSIRASG